MYRCTLRLCRCKYPGFRIITTYGGGISLQRHKLVRPGFHLVAVQSLQVSAVLELGSVSVWPCTSVLALLTSSRSPVKLDINPAIKVEAISVTPSTTMLKCIHPVTQAQPQIA